MSKIRILPEQLANQIAAGEVVERPASVVKELVENSLDAGATRIEIEIEGGGTRLIRIIDNGSGMDEDDLLLSLERHGTSKIANEQDLSAITTLGFRGEAIPSIGSVSHLTITSRPAAAQLGSRVVLEYGKLTKAHEIGSGRGTTSEVRNLFGNTPARRKFLRTARTELGHIEDVVKNYALGSPAVTFIVRIDGRSTISLDNTLSLAERLGHILHFDGPFIPVQLSGTNQLNRELSGLLVPPEKVTIGPAKLHIFVNGRAIRDRMITHAVTEGMRSFLLKGKNPSGLVHLTLPPDEVDVNVHPAKHEVRFRNSRDIHELIRGSVAQALWEQQAAMKSVIFNKDRTVETTRIPLDCHEISPFSPTQDDFTSSLPSLVTREPAPHNDRPSPKPPSAATAATRIRETQPLLAATTPLPRTVTIAKEDSVSANSKPAGHTPPDHSLLIIGQYDDLYIFCRSSDGLVVIDQHAAHERLLYEKFRKQYQANKITRQTLMFPETVVLSLFQTRLVETHGEEIDRLGFSIRDFGGNTFIISAIPALAGTVSPRSLFLDILEQFGSEATSSDKGGFLDTVLATMACKAAVKSGTRLSEAEINRLLSEMAKADLFSHCPHGRPVVRQFSREEVKKWFYRT